MGPTLDQDLRLLGYSASSLAADAAYARSMADHAAKVAKMEKDEAAKEEEEEEGDEDDDDDDGEGEGEGEEEGEEGAFLVDDERPTREERMAKRAAAQAAGSSTQPKGAVMKRSTRGNKKGAVAKQSKK